MLRKAVIITISLFISQMTLLAHGSWQQHAEDMYKVFGFKRSDELTNWMKFVSSVLIDNKNADSAFSDDDKPFNFYSYLQTKYPGFQCKHRLLFHWGYNSKPWSPYLQEKTSNYGWSEEMIKEFQADLIAEQKRRNRFANEYTENLFGFEHGGKEARIARIFISIAYDVHLLGDYEPDNTDLDGLQDLESVVGDIINNLKALDKVQSSFLCKQLKKASQEQGVDTQKKAEDVLDLLKNSFSDLLKKANNGMIAEHLYAKGFRFEEINPSSPCFENSKSKKERSTLKSKRARLQSSSSIGIVIFLSLATLGILLALLFKKRK